MNEQPEQPKEDVRVDVSETSSPKKSTQSDFVVDSKLAIESEGGGLASASLYILLAVIITGIVWAYYAEIEEVTTGEGKVIPPSELQIIQNLEGGIVEKINVREGQSVKKGDVLVEMDDTRFSSQHKERLAKKAVLEAEVVRLSAEVEGKKSLEFPQSFSDLYPAVVAQASEQFHTNKTALDAGIAILKRSYALTKREYDIVLPLARQGVMSEVDRVRLERQLVGIKGQILEKKDKARIEAHGQLNKVKAELAVLNEQMSATQDRIDRTLVRSPVNGIVNQIHISTVGAVLQPGQKIMEVVPVGDKLTVQAYIRPSDIGFISPGQDSIVKISTYDFSIYGGLGGKVSKISPDAILDEQGNSFYEVQVETDKGYLIGKNEKHMPIMPGMTVSVSIVTGKKSILDYILKPFMKAQQTALRER